MKKLIYMLLTGICWLQLGCDDANELLDRYIQDGPIVYAARITELEIKPGYERVGVQIFPAEDVNKSHAILRWNNAEGSKDSVRVDYTEANYDTTTESYYTIIDMPNIEGNVLLEGWNVDVFGNPSLLITKGGYVYGPNYLSTLLHSLVYFTSGNTVAVFDNKVGVVDNLVSYEQDNGQFTPETKVVNTLSLVNAKSGGRMRSKTRYVISENDLDTLTTPTYLETVLP